MLYELLALECVQNQVQNSGETRDNHRLITTSFIPWKAAT